MLGSRLWVGVILTLCGMFFGIAAYEMTTESAISAWEKTHFPSAEVFAHAMGSQGRFQLKDEILAQRALRSLPLRTDDDSSVWISEDRNWITYFLQNEEGPPARVYCVQCKNVRISHWSYLGNGWNGLEKVLAELKTARNRSPVLHERRVSYKDPREIEF